jgi:hypothetical protein
MIAVKYLPKEYNVYWHLHPVLGNDSETGNYTTGVTE